MTSHTGSRRAVCILGLCAAALIAPPAYAQIDDIVVTARKREESLQEVPLSITALSAEQLEERGIANNYEVALYTPNFNTSQTVGRTIDRPTIRGMANSSVGGEPNASYFIDGIFVSSSISTATTDSIERVEVLRGPQSAQFGRATFSGAINYVTRNPTDDWEGQLNAKAGSNDDYRTGGWFSGPLIKDKLGILISGGYSDFGGEWSNNLRTATDGYNPASPFVPPPDPSGGYAYTGPNPPVSDQVWINPPTRGDTSSLGGEKTTDFMAKLVWTPTDETKVDLKYAYTKGDDEHWPSLVPLAGVLQVNCYLPGDPGAGPETPGAFCGTLSPDGYENRINIPDFAGMQSARPQQGYDWYSDGVEPGTRRDTNRVLLNVDQALGDWNMTGRVAYNKDEYEQAFDLDHTNMRVLAGLFHFLQQTDSEDEAVEIRFDSPGDYKIRGSIGAYYYHYESENAIRSFTGPYVALGGQYECPRPDNDPVCSGPGPYYVTTDFPPSAFSETDNMAVFGSLDWDITDQLTFSIEARWANDEKKLIGGNAATADTETDAFTPRFTLNYQLNDDIMVYGLVSKGNKPADFNGELFRYDVLRQLSTAAVTGYIDPSLPQATQDDLAKFANDALVKEEEQWTYELGMKSSWLDRRITANVSAFFIDWENQALFKTNCTLQTITFTELCFTTRFNAGTTHIYGAEIETNFVVTDNLFLIANYGYQHGEVQEGTTDDTTLINQDLKGKEIPNSPNHSLVLGAVVTNQLTSTLEGFMRADFVYESERWNQIENYNELDSRKIVNLRLGVESDQWTVTGYITNLLDDQTPWAALNFFDFGQQLSNGESPRIWSLNPSRGRNYGIELAYRFGPL